ncbi:metallophosphoesterase family protein [Zobellella maritima]|uniref:metallophosphoesterase family protein n=1 Tax=Zobellella maritima TaxID=2059725 RepID=UPI000E308873|nr:metallophosphatase family protein [Zobellella maritima]
MTIEGRSCPLSYRIDPRQLGQGPAPVRESVYIIGGLYGNWTALTAIEALQQQEVAAGLVEPGLVFNGDFNWFNVDNSSFRLINETVLAHNAIQGNVEAELCAPSAGAGCGCGYPEWVDGETVTRSNAIMTRLQQASVDHGDMLGRLKQLPRQLALTVAGHRVQVLHGDPESLSGWQLALEAMPEPGQLTDRLADWFGLAGARIFACSHTCLPYMQDFDINGVRHLVVNNGAAGMPNFRGDRRGVLTRLSSRPSPVPVLYGTRLGALYCDAIPIDWDEQWDDWFASHWPPGSPAWASYRERFIRGPEHRPEDAVRLTGALNCCL